MVIPYVVTTIIDHWGWICSVQFIPDLMLSPYRTLTSPFPLFKYACYLCAAKSTKILQSVTTSPCAAFCTTICRTQKVSSPPSPPFPPSPLSFPHTSHNHQLQLHHIYPHIFTQSRHDPLTNWHTDILPACLPGSARLLSGRDALPLLSAGAGAAHDLRDGHQEGSTGG